MKIVKYTCFGRVPSKKNSRVTNRKTGRSFPSKIYTKWHKETSKQLKETGLPCRPIVRVFKCKLDIYYPDYRVADNTNKAESVHDILVDLNIIADDAWKNMPKTSQDAHYRKNDGGFSVYLYVDENHPDNAEVPWKQLPVIDEII
jgi:hypothetical protein